MPREEASTFQFILCLIWKSGDSNFGVKICLALEESIFQVEWLKVSHFDYICKWYLIYMIQQAYELACVCGLV